VKSAPKVSVVTISYNQEKYIGAALESFVEQQTDFDFEVIVADDCSTDKTADIIADYAKKYPKIFRPILRKVNFGVQKNIQDALQHAAGKYIALCEGDDFWTDPTKLQRQADFLDKHPDYNLCFHPVTVFFENQEEKDEIYPAARPGHRFTVGELLRWNFMQTVAPMSRKRTYDHLPTDILPLDWYLHLYHAQGGKIGFIDRVMGAYRRHPGGLWWSSHTNVDAIWRKHGVKYFGMYVEILKLYGETPRYRDTLHVGMDELCITFLGIDTKYGDTLLKELFNRFPAEAEAFITRQRQQLKQTEASLKTTEETLQAKSNEAVHWHKMVDQKEAIIQAKDQEIRDIKASKIWRTRNKVARVVGKKVI